MVQVTISDIECYQVYNVCSATKTEIGTIVEEITSNLPFTVTCEYSAATPRDKHGYAGSFDRISKDINWAPQIDVTEGIKRTIAWALNLS